MGFELNYQSSERVITEVTKTEKYWIHTNHGKLLDTMMGNSAFIFGYDNQHIKQRMKDVQDKTAFLNFKHNEICVENTELIDKICNLGGYSALGWAVSGSDGVECALAINDYYWECLDSNRTQIVSFSPGYHGSTYLAKMLRKEAPGFDKVIVLDAPEWSNLSDRRFQEIELINSLSTVLNENKKIGAVIFESIPWYKGIKPWSEQFWIDLRSTCDNYEINLILDDVMGGVGKLGHYFSQDRFNIRADITALGKSLTGGFSPLSCACTTEKIKDVIQKRYEYGHTWQPNMAGIGAALGVLDLFNTKQIYSVESRLNNFGKILVSKGYATDFVCQGLVFSANLVEPLKLDSFVKNGLTGGPDMKFSISMIAPAIADDEYFEESEIRSIKAIEEKNV